MPTRRGRLLLFGALLCYSLARALSVDELFSLAIACVSFPLVSVIFVRWRRHSIEFTRTITPKRSFAGASSLRVGVSATNPTRTPTPPIQITDELPESIGGSLRLALPSMRPKTSAETVAERTPRSRGAYPVGPMVARLTDPFGLAEVRKEVVPRTSVIVYPRVELLHESHPPEAPAGGGQAPVYRMATTGDELYAVRGWQEGDDLRKIHWRSTARTGDLMIRQDENRLFPRATILVDTRGAAHRGAGSSSSLEFALSFAASIVWELSRQGFGIRLATTDVTPSQPRWGRDAVDPLLTTLALAAPSVAPGYLGAVRSLGSRTARGGALFAIVPTPDPEHVVQLGRLRRVYDWCAAVVLDSASFEHASGRERAAYDQQIADVERGLTRAGWRVVTAGANDTVSKTWESLIAARVSRPRLRSARSS